MPLPDHLKKMWDSKIATLHSYFDENIVVVSDPTSPMRCPNCRFDRHNKTSSGIYSPTVPYPSSTVTSEYPNGIPGPTDFSSGQCPICKGEGLLNQANSEVTIPAMIRRLVGDDTEIDVGGKKIYADFIIKAALTYRDLLLAAKEIQVDGVRAQIVRTERRVFGEEYGVRVWTKKYE